MMTPAEFSARAVGIPWARWRSDWAAMDCFGLVVLYHRLVLGVDPGPVPHTGIAEGFAATAGWQQCEPEPDAVGFMSWRDGAPMHCGILLGADRLLHAREGVPIPQHGSVRITRLAAMARLVPDLRFYRFTGARAC